MSVSNESVSSSDNDEWSQCYHELSKCFCTVAGAKFPCGYYLQTYGGGPEGGYVVSEDTKTVWSVERNWGTPFKMEVLSDDTKLCVRLGVDDVEVTEIKGAKDHDLILLENVPVAKHIDIDEIESESETGA